MASRNGLSLYCPLAAHALSDRDIETVERHVAAELRDRRQSLEKATDRRLKAEDVVLEGS